jgi:hypothetical protein
VTSLCHASAYGAKVHCGLELGTADALQDLRKEFGAGVGERGKIVFDRNYR